MTAGSPVAGQYLAVSQWFGLWTLKKKKIRIFALLGDVMMHASLVFDVFTHSIELLRRLLLLLLFKLSGRQFEATDRCICLAFP